MPNIFTVPRNQATGNTGATNTTASTSDVSTGFGITITTSSTGRLLITCHCPVSNNTLNDGVYLSIYRVTGSTVPLVNAATTGAVIGGGGDQFTSATANAIGVIALSLIDSPGIGTFTYYLTYRAITGGTATFGSGGISDISAVEV